MHTHSNPLAPTAQVFPLTFDLSTATETDLLRAEIRNDQLRFHHSRGGNFQLCEVIPLPMAVALAKALLTVIANTEYDEMLIARYEEAADARADALSAHWGHD